MSFKTFAPNKGYFVALVGYEKTYDIPKTSNRWSDVITDFLAKKMKITTSQENIYLGFWLHNGKLFVGLTQRIDDRNEAIREGYARGQIAIYDAEVGKDIYMNRVSNDPDLLNSTH